LFTVSTVPDGAGIGGTEATVTSCERVTAAGAVEQPVILCEADAAARGAEIVELGRIAIGAIGRRRSIFHRGSLDVGLDTEQQMRRGHEVVADLSAADHGGVVAAAAADIGSVERGVGR
jgi:hypothetical protein